MLRDEISSALKSSMKEKDPVAVSTLRLIQAAIKDRDIAARSKGVDDGISDDQILQVLQTMVRQRHESIEMYKRGNRDELAARGAGRRERAPRLAAEARLSTDNTAPASDPWQA